MKNKKVLTFLLMVSVFIFPSKPSWAYWVWSPESGKFVNPEGAVQDSAQEQYDYAMQLYKERDLKEAAEQFSDLLKKFPNSRSSPEAQYRLGTIYEEQGDYMKAFRAYKALIESYPQSERLNEVIEREFRIGNLFLSGRKAKLMGVEILPSLPRAVEIFQHIVDQAPYSEWGDKAQFRLGLSYKKWQHWNEAVESFQGLVEQYPDSPLVADARFQLAETAFLRSASAARDQRALDDASTAVDKFLTRYPESTTSEKAAKLRQEIDEKNAEKNYRIGLYYEKENYLSSALIYYSDVAKTYAHTKWGEKAKEKLQSLKEPAAYLTGQEKEIREELDVVKAKREAVGDDDAERKRLERKQERLEEHLKNVEKNKSESLNRREEDIKRREAELKEKFKNLDKKAKLLEENPSEDLKRAIDRWRSSLMAEQDQLYEEKQQLKDWREQLGVDGKPFYLDVLPFVGEDQPAIEKVRRIDAKKLYKVANQKKLLLSEKELLYKQHQELSAHLRDLEMREMGIGESGVTLEEASKMGDERISQQQRELQRVRQNIDTLEKRLNEKKSLYQHKFGMTGWLAWMQVPQKIVTTSAGVVTSSLDKSWDWVNPFDSEGSGLENKSLEDLLELRMHLKEKIAAQQNITQSLSQAFDDELALQEQKKLLQTLESDGKDDVRDLRRQVKRLEKEIRGRYEEIQDRHERKKDLIKALEKLVKQGDEEQGILHRTGKAIASPVFGAVRFSRAFLFGLPDKDVELTKAAESMPKDLSVSKEARKLKEDIELESLLIEAKSRELKKYEKELEILRAKASLDGGIKFRSAIVTVPYELFNEAIDQAKRIVPSKDRHEVIIQKLDEETRELERLRSELKEVEKWIKVREKGEAAPPQPAQAAPTQPLQQPAASADESLSKDQEKEAAQMKEEIETLARQIQTQQEVYKRQKTALEMQVRAFEREETGQRSGVTKDQKATIKQKEKIKDELGEITDALSKVIEKEKDLEHTESDVLAKRINRIDQLLQGVTSKAVSQDLLTERDRIEKRLSQLEMRESFLTKELDRIQIPETTSSSQ